MTQDNIMASRAPKPVGCYPHARRVGDLLFLSGVGPRQANGDPIPEGIEAQCHAVFANVKAVLDEAGSAWEKLVDITVFLTDMQRDFACYNEIYATYFTKAQPCRTTVGISALPTPILIELKCIAEL